MVVEPRSGGYWVDGGADITSNDTVIPDVISDVISEGDMSDTRLETDEKAQCYRKHFLGKVDKSCSHGNL